MVVPILTYHEISGRNYPTYRRFTVRPEDFHRQMSWLSDRKYATVSFDDLSAWRAGRARLPPRPIVLTFDDGCRECVKHATAILPKFGFTGTFYLVAGFMGATTAWMKERRALELPIIDWATARELVASGFRCGSHTVNHDRLTDVSPDRSRDELVRSQDMIEQQLGSEVVHLSYPYGSFNERVRQMASEAGYRTAVTVQPGLSGRGDDLLALPRITIAGDESFMDFKLRVKTGKRVDELLPRPVYAAASRAKRLLAAARSKIR